MSRLRWLPLAVLGAVVSAAASTLLFSTFMIYDDEGYVLFSLKNFVEGGGLYSRVYSQYGPFFYLFNQALHFIGLEFNNTDGRIVTLVCWLGAAGLCAALVWRVTRSHIATAFTLGGVDLHLWPMTSEPSHPGGLIVLVTAIMAWCGVQWSGQPRKLAAATGIVGAALLLTKINVGLFLFASAGVWWLLHLDETRLSPRVRTALAGGALALLPVALMWKLLDREWVATFALVAATGGLTTVIAVAHGATPASRWRDFGVTAAAAAAVTVFTTLAIVAQGTSWSALLEGVVLGPLHHPLAYTAPVHWRDGSVALVVISFALAAWIALAPSPRSFGAVAAGRVLVAGFYYVSWLLVWPESCDNFTLSYGLVVAWFFVQPLGGDRSTQRARAWLGLLFGLQALHAFPVAGSQISWGTFLFVPLLAIGIHDLVRVHAGGTQPTIRRWRAVAGAVLVLVTTVRCAEFAWIGILRVRSSDALRLPGASRLQLPEHLTTALRLLARNASAHADVLFSLPGMDSFYLWTNVPPPTAANVTHWFTLLSPAQQDAIQARLDAAPRSCVIVQRNLYDFLVRTGVPTTSPLTLWLLANYEPAFALETYEFWVRKGRKIAALDTAMLFEATARDQPRYRIALTLAVPTARKIAAIELGRFDGDRSTLIKTWTNADAKVVQTPINSAGAEAGPEHRVTFPFGTAGFVRIDLFVDQLPPYCPREHSVLYLRDTTGERVAEVRFVQ